MVRIEDYSNGKPAWCPGCGNYSILEAVKKALVKLKIGPNQVLMVSGIGQAAKLPHYMKCNLFNGLHGRTLPVATGAKIVNPNLTVIAVGGDGDGYGEGGNHLIHTIRRNPNITYLVHDNQIYGLTKGQASPTTEEGAITKTTPIGTFVRRLNPIALAISLGVSFVARGFCGDIGHLSELISNGIQNKGFSLIDILQPCVTFNRINTWNWYRERIYQLNDQYEPTDKIMAFRKALEWGKKIPIGVIYKERRLAYEDQNPKIIDKSIKEQPHYIKIFETILDDFAI
jgi:2-oxoglutarate ferredoxin oxidoreductase subunit beta